jgi:1,4-alpha-glucan branching enzyme
MNAGDIIHGPSLLSEFDVYLFREGTHFRLYEKMGSHMIEHDGEEGTLFSVWAPNAEKVSVTGDFNDWNELSHPLGVRYDSSGIWEGFVPGLKQGELYKYHVASKLGGYSADKRDPFAFFGEVPPGSASRVWDLSREWRDEEWISSRREKQKYDAPISIYEVHPGSWRRVPEEENRSLTYDELATLLTSYVNEMGFTHVEFTPIMEHPFYGSWGYLTSGYFSPTSRFGTPQDLMGLVDDLHGSGIGVILDWVPSHFPTDEHGLGFFDGTHLFEHSDPRKGFHPDWNSFIFNYGRNETRNFLLSSALFWLDRYHADGLRVDAVASMIYLDYSRKEGEWIPNRFGGRENLEAIDFIRKLNEEIYGNYPGVQTFAEESTAWPMVSRPTYVGGLGFGYKWDMGWMHDILRYFSNDPVFRKYHQNELTFRMIYAFNENFVLPLSHDEVVHGKGSLIGKMPGDKWQKLANLRLLLGYMFFQPGKKLLFMGSEFGQEWEWYHDGSLDWDLLDDRGHDGIKRLVGDLNRLYREEPALHTLDNDHRGFEWIDFGDSDHSVVSFLRKGKDNSTILAAFNFTPVPRHNYRLGVPYKGYWKEILNTDSRIYGGSGQGNMGGCEALPIRIHGRRYSVNTILPPLAMAAFKTEGGED